MKHNELQGFGTDSGYDPDERVTVEMTAAQRRFISDVMADVYFRPGGNVRDKVNAVGIRRVLCGKEWSDGNVKLAERFVRKHQRKEMV